MYLQRSEFSTYYSRIPVPKSLRDTLSVPSTIRISLRTKDRRIAVKRNARTSALILELFEDTNSTPSSEAFKSSLANLKAHISQFWDQVGVSPTIDPNNAKSPLIPPSTANCSGSDNAAAKKRNYRDVNWLIRKFIAYKNKTGITAKSVRQLESRLAPLPGFVGERNLQNLNLSDAMSYQETLLDRDWQAKTVKEYLSVARMFCDWCVGMRYLRYNPFEHLKLVVKESRAPHAQRAIWSVAKLHHLFSFDRFSKLGSIDDFWIPLLLLHTGLRPSEACQLRTSDLKPCTDSGIWYLEVTDDGYKQKVKTPTARRQVPLHHMLIARGFLNYVQQRRKLRKVQLFECSPTGKDDDWSRNFSQRFNRFLTSQLKYETKDRPTAYSFRHTFVDALKKLDVKEHLVSEIVGHSNASQTYGRYGKPAGLAQKLEVIDRLDFGIKFR